MTAAVSTPPVGITSADGTPGALQPIVAASCAVVRDGRVLIATRGRPPMAGLWSLPGGRVELGESLEQAALRELQEEVGVAAEPVGLAGYSEYIEADDAGVRHHFVIIAIAARWVGGEATISEEAEQVDWALPEEIASRSTTSGLLAIAERALALVRA